MKITTVDSIPGVTRARTARKRTARRGYVPRKPPVDRYWTGPNGSQIRIIAGSMAKPPRRVLLLIDRVLRRNRPWHNGSIDALIRNCRSGCDHGYGSKHHLSLYLSKDIDGNLLLVEHEMAHATNRLMHRETYSTTNRRGDIVTRSKWSDRHGPGFYDALFRIGKAEGNLRTLTNWQSNKAAMKRARLRAEGKAA